MRMLNCKDTSRLVSESMDRKLPWRKRLEVRLHLFVCDNCARYKMQLYLLRRVFKNHAVSQEEASSPVLDEKVKDRLRRLVEKNEPSPK